MTKPELYDKFTELFPEWTGRVIGFKRIQPRVLKLQIRADFEDPTQDVMRYFMYINEDDWSFGTKIYRNAPKYMKKKEENKNE